MNNSARVDGFDLAAIGKALGSPEGDENYATATDLDRDGMIDGMDLDLLSQCFGLEIE